MQAEDCRTNTYAIDATPQVIVAIRAVQDHKGASRQAIVKYLKAEFQCENGVAIKKALKSDKLVQTGQSFINKFVILFTIDQTIWSAELIKSIAPLL